MALDYIQTQMITAEQVAEQEAREGFGREIVNGEWVEEMRMAGERHGQIILKLTLAIAPYVLQNKLGRFHPDQVNYVLRGMPNHIEVMRIPDLSFVAAEKVQPIQEGFLYFAPDLAIEVVSPFEKPAETRAKIRDYLTYGTRQVWVFYPDQQILIIHFADGTRQTYTAEEILICDDLFPTLEIDLARIFED